MALVHVGSHTKLDRTSMYFMNHTSIYLQNGVNMAALLKVYLNKTDLTPATLYRIISDIYT